MCVQCMAGAMTVGAGASGARAWLATRRWAWLTPVRLKRITLTLLTTALIASGVLIGGSAPSRDGLAARGQDASTPAAAGARP